MSDRETTPWWAVPIVKLVLWLNAAKMFVTDIIFGRKDRWL